MIIFKNWSAVKPNQLPAAANDVLPVAIWKYDTAAIDTRPTLLTQTSLPEVQHHENAFNDFTVQTLLPNYLSRQGPCIAGGQM